MSEKQQDNSPHTHMKLSFPPDLIDTPQIEAILQKSINYIKSGVFVHLKGATNTGKTTYARYIACLLQQPVVSIRGKIFDNETVLQIQQAANEGHTLIFDDCQHASKSNWQLLLPLLEDHLLNFPLVTPAGAHIHQIHPKFTAIFTSNSDQTTQWSIPTELLENCTANILLPAFDQQTLATIIHAKAKLNALTAQAIVYLKAQLADYFQISVKTAIILGKVMAMNQIDVVKTPSEFKDVCTDLLCFSTNADTTQVIISGIEQTLEEFAQHITHVTTNPTANVVTTQETETQDEIAPKEIPTEKIQEEEILIDEMPSEEVTIMLQSEVELAMHFYDGVISFMQDISNDEAEVSFNHSADSSQPDILMTIAREFLPQIVHFVQQRVEGKVSLEQNASPALDICDVLIQISKPEIDEAQARIEKLKKLIANYEHYHQSNTTT